MTQLIRVEHEDGYGMFIGWDEHDEYRDHQIGYGFLDDLYNRHSRFNSPSEDGLNLTPKHFCAYISIEQIQEWIFPEEFKELVCAGYTIYLLEVKRCKIGKHQAIYKKQDVVTKKDISSLFIKN